MICEQGCQGGFSGAGDSHDDDKVWLHAQGYSGPTLGTSAEVTLGTSAEVTLGTSAEVTLETSVRLRLGTSGRLGAGDQRSVEAGDPYWEDGWELVLKRC